MNNENQTKESKAPTLSKGDVIARLCDLPIGTRYKYNKEDIGVFTIIERDGQWLRIQRHNGRGNHVYNDNTMVYPLNEL